MQEIPSIPYGHDVLGQITFGELRYNTSSRVI